jgi:glycosyltransferase involved in cell wall biosynthesis
VNDAGSARTLDLLSVVAPVRDEEDAIEAFHARTVGALEGIPFELVLVDDGSADRTPELLERLAEHDPRLKVISLSRSFGYQAAVTAGLDHATGEAVVTIDADLQDPPELIPDLLDRWRQGADVVYAVREAREGERWTKVTTARWFSRLFVRMAELDVPEDAGDFRLLDRRAVDALGAMPERSRFLRGMSVWVGFTQASIPYTRDPRYAGDTRYTWRTLFRISLDAVSSFSKVPLQLATVLGFLVSGLAFLGIPYIVVSRALGFYVKGISSLLLAVLLLGGIQLITLGIIGEYIGRIYDEVKRRPLYVVKARRNVRAPEPPAPPPEERAATELHG